MHDRRAGPSRGPLVALVVPLLLLVLAGGLRFSDLGHPDRIHFDEVFYANDADSLLERGVEEERPAHPPAGKWLIAAGIAAFGFDPVGWRVASAAAGTLTVLLVYLIGLRLFGGSHLLAGLAGLLVAIDGIALTMSRIAMLDVFLGLFVTAAFLALLVSLSATGRRDVLAWRTVTGVLLGLAVATKWSGASAVAAAVLVAGVAALARWRRAGGAGSLLRLVAGLAVPLLVVPAAVYVASYAGWFAAYPSAGAGVDGSGRFECPDDGCDDSVAGAARAWVREQRETVRFHQRLVVSHPYRSHAAGWPVLLRPVLAYLERCPQSGDREGEPCEVATGNKAKILVVGNPGVWWPALLAYPVLAWSALVRRDVRAAAIAAFLLLQWAPWLLSEKRGFLFYLTPVVPFVALAMAYAVARVRAGRSQWAVAVALVALAVTAATYLLPLWLGLELSVDGSDARLLLPTWR